MFTVNVAIATRRQPAETAWRFAEDAISFWDQVSEGYWDMNVHAYKLLEEFRDCDCGPPFFANQELRATWETLTDLPDWAMPVSKWHILGGVEPDACGHANLNGSYGATYIDGGRCTSGSTAHELGHNFDLMHSNLIHVDDDGEVEIEDYEDKDSIMGSRSPLGLHACNMHHLGFFKNDEVHTVTHNERLLLCPWEVPPAARHEGEKPYVIITSPEGNQYHKIKGKFFVSTRKLKGYPYRLRGRDNPQVFIHIANKASYHIDTLEVGEASDKIPGVIITHAKHENEVSEVWVRYLDDASVPAPVTLNPASAIPTHHPIFKLGKRNSGLWWHPKMNGQGFDVHATDDSAIIYWYTFSEHDRNPPRQEWFVLSPSKTEGRFDVFYTTGGQFWDPTRAESVKIGEATFELGDDSHAMLRYNTTLHGRGALPLEALLFNDDVRDGIYYNKERDKEGFSMRFFGDRCLGYWYTHRNASERGWFTIDGKRTGQGEYVCNLLSAKGEFIRYQSQRVKSKVLGQVAVRWVSPTAFRFTSNLKDLQVDYVARKLF